MTRAPGDAGSISRYTHRPRSHVQRLAAMSMRPRRRRNRQGCGTGDRKMRGSNAHRGQCAAPTGAQLCRARRTVLDGDAGSARLPACRPPNASRDAPSGVNSGRWVYREIERTRRRMPRRSIIGRSGSPPTILHERTPTRASWHGLARTNSAKWAVVRPRKHRVRSTSRLAVCRRASAAIRGEVVAMSTEVPVPAGGGR